MELAQLFGENATFGKNASKPVLYSYLTSVDEGDYR